MTTRLNRIVSLGGAAALVAAIAFSTGARADTAVHGSGLTAIAGDDDFDPLCGHHYEVADINPLCGHHYLT